MEKVTRNTLLVGGMAVVLVFTIGLFLSENTADLDFSSGEVAIVSLDGAITSTDSGFGSSSLTPEKVRNLNSRVESTGAEAVIYEINSGGGAVVASKDIMREIESVDIPTVCRMRDVAASGGYLIALGCDEIVADSTTITGSIGVRSSYLEFSGLMQKLGIEQVNITAGEFKGVGSPYRNATRQEKRILQEKADMIHTEFKSLVVERRNLSREEVENVSTGEIFLGKEAYQLGLVDGLGGRKEAVKVAENLTGRDLEIKKVDTGPEFGIGNIAGLQIFLPESESPLKAEIN